MRHRFAVTVGLILALVGTSAVVAAASPSSGQGARSARRSSAPPVQMSFYDDHQDAIVVTDSSSRSEAKTLKINYAPGLAALDATVFPDIFRVEGAAASGQLPVLAAEPGEDTYAPIWREATVTWNPYVTPVLLTSDTQIDQAEADGDLTFSETMLLLNAPVIASDVTDPTAVSPPEAFSTFYDGHQDGMLATDVSTRSQARAEGINYSPVLASLDPAGFPEIYVFKGRMAKGQLQVLGSEPGEPSYSPLWVETVVRWRKGATPSVVKSDTRIDALIEAGKMVEHGTTVVLNCPVVPGRGSGGSYRGVVG
jgi:hypothetical protein